ncbi:hypothetical protein PYW07_000079 [Mythimna separata]|uniref:Uncharacterized protein n=1 Tax=Mythimna separata TaxID=271217 RepID=A0AAD8E066_MYTSE|nr:hypothetical protein PYW07_000079 [Mythimna separata]
MDLLIVLFIVATADARMFCEKTKAPLEMGEWRYDLKQLDSAVVENPPNSINEGQTYVYENYFPNYTIKYIHVDNLAIKTCGASASIKSGGLGSSSVLIVLTARINQEIRSVVDIWGKKNTVSNATDTPPRYKKIKSLYMFRNMRAVSHNRPSKYEY